MTRIRKKNQTKTAAILMGVFVIVIMVASTLAYVLTSYGSSNPELTYNGQKFSVDSSTGKYVAKIGKQTHSFYYHPLDVESVGFTPEIKGLLSNSQLVVVSFDPSLDPGLLVYADTFRFELPDLIQKPVIGGVVRQKQGFDFPVLTCSNSTALTPVIVLNDSIETNIQKQDSCIIINARGPEVLRVKDRIAYSFLGVMNE